MSDDALAYLVEAFGDVTDAELQRFLDTTPAILQPSSDLRDSVIAGAILVESPEVLQAARA
jgi:hypothetical protein